MMQHRRTVTTVIAIGSLMSLAACARDVIAPTAAPSQSAEERGSNRDATETRFLNPAPGAPTIANPVITFWAVKGRDQRVDMVYSAASFRSSSSSASSDRRGSGGRSADDGHGDAIVFAEFRVREKSLASRPDGVAIAEGDSVLITMTLVDATHGIIEFQPSGLKFSATHPAQLKISFEHANLDLNGDGVIDARDRLIQQTFHISVRENPGDPFLPLPSMVNSGLNEVEAAILGFSGYAIEY